MTDLRATIIPKSDQLNADDLIGGKTLTIKITKVTLVGGDQPVILNYEGDNGHPYKPGKSMRRVLIHVWGDNGNNYIGRSLTLYCDEKVQFGGMAVGGIRISHMSHIDAPVTKALTETRAKRKLFTVKPLMQEQQKSTGGAGATWRSELWAKAQAANITADQFAAQFGSLKTLPEEKREEVEVWIQDMKLAMEE